MASSHSEAPRSTTLARRLHLRALVSIATFISEVVHALIVYALRTLSLFNDCILAETTTVCYIQFVYRSSQR